VAGVSLTPPGGSIPNSECRCVSTWAPGTFGNFGRNGLRASGISQLDLGLARDVSISERVKACFRADAFNVFNRAQYAAPNAKLSQVNFGEITTTISNYARGRGTPREIKLFGDVFFLVGHRSVDGKHQSHSSCAFKPLQLIERIGCGHRNAPKVFGLSFRLALVGRV